MFAQTAREMDFDGIWITDKDIPAISEVTGVHRTTVARWLAKGELPMPVYRLLDLIYNGNLGRLHPDWAGFSINPRSGELHTPIERPVTPGELLALPYRYEMIRHLKAELRALHEAHADAADVIEFPRIAG